MTELEFQLRASDLLETVRKIQRDQAAASTDLLEALKDMTSKMDELITALHLDAQIWRERYEAERQAHIVDLQHYERDQV